MRKPTEPLSTNTWSISWHEAPPGAHTVTLANKVLAPLNGPISTVTGKTFEGEVPAVEPVAGVLAEAFPVDVPACEAAEPPPPPPHPGSCDRRTMKTAVMNRRIA
jgi:hypothetical protein